MSIESWKAEYYPERAIDCAEEAGGDPIPLLEHSIRKWKGLWLSVLMDHEGHKEDGENEVYFDDGLGCVRFYIDTDSCALCRAFYSRATNCAGCPLVPLRGVRCDRDDASGGNPYNAWEENSDPGPMIALLERALAEAVKNDQAI